MSNKSKQFCVFDPKSNDFVCLSCSLRSDINQVKWKEFFDQLYAVRMDSSYCFKGKSEFGEGNNIVSLKNELIQMLKDPDSLSFERIYHLFDTDEQRQSLKLASIIHQFIDLFTFDVLERYTSREFSIMEKALFFSNFSEKSPVFERQHKSVYYNTRMILFSGYPLNRIISQKKDVVNCK